MKRKGIKSQKKNSSTKEIIGGFIEFGNELALD